MWNVHPSVNDNSGFKSSHIVTLHEKCKLHTFLFYEHYWSSGSSVDRTPPALSVSFSGFLHLVLWSAVVADERHVRLVAPRRALRTFPDEKRQRVPAECNVLEGVEKEDAQNNGEEATDGSHHSISGHTQPFLEENSRAGHDRRGEEDVVDGRNDRGIKDVKGFVQVADLNADTDYQADD